MCFTCSSLCFSISSSLFICSSSSRLARSSSYNTKLLKPNSTTFTTSTQSRFLEFTHLLHLGQSLLHGLHCRLAGSLLLLFLLLLPLLLLLVLLFFVSLSLICRDKKKNRLEWHLYNLIINAMFSLLRKNLDLKHFINFLYLENVLSVLCTVMQVKLFNTAVPLKSAASLY